MKGFGRYMPCNEEKEKKFLIDGCFGVISHMGFGWLGFKWTTHRVSTMYKAWMTSNGHCTTMANMNVRKAADRSIDTNKLNHIYPLNSP